MPKNWWMIRIRFVLFLLLALQFCIRIISEWKVIQEQNSLPYVIPVLQSQPSIVSYTHHFTVNSYYQQYKSKAFVQCRCPNLIWCIQLFKYSLCLKTNSLKSHSQQSVSNWINEESLAGFSVSKNQSARTVSQARSSQEQNMGFIILLECKGPGKGSQMGLRDQGQVQSTGMQLLPMSLLKDPQ